MFAMIAPSNNLLVCPDGHHPENDPNRGPSCQQWAELPMADDGITRCQPCRTVAANVSNSGSPRSKSTRPYVAAYKRNKESSISHA